MEVSLCPEKHFIEPDGHVSTDIVPSEHAPALSSSRALARFEFEAGRGNEGTKILMVEWLDEDGVSDWQISWEGKTTVLPAKDVAVDKLLRIYFLLAPGASIPRIVNISRVGGDSQHMQTNPLPAIFPPELGATSQVRKGVLHTLWAKKRLSVLEKEIELEMNNGEGVGLEMALQEKQWIQDNFGVVSKVIPELQYSMTPSDRSSHIRRFPQRLKTLSLATIPTENISFLESRSSDLLSPDSSDVAVSSFSLFKSSCHPSPNTQTTKPNSQPTSTTKSKRHNIQSTKQKSFNGHVFQSIDAVANDQASINEEIVTEDELFALKLSPRSPEMTRSPFCGNL